MYHPPSSTLERPSEAVLLEAGLIVDNLPPGGADNYLLYRQPEYPDNALLITTVALLRESQGVATIDEIDALQSALTEVQTGHRSGPVLTNGRCAEPVYPEQATADEKARHVAMLADEAQIFTNINRLVHRDALLVPRLGLQSSKPRSEALDANGCIPFMGDMINDQALNQRIPNPQRMLVALEQAQALDTELQRRDLSPWAAHEGLLLPFEEGMLRTDPNDPGRLYSAASHMIWAGERTRKPGDPHIRLLGRIANPIGVKIGPTATAEDIAALQLSLNPYNTPGRLTFMIRMGLQHHKQLRTVIKGIAKYAPTAIVGYDVHGSTEQVEHEGVTHKVRSVPKTVGGIAMLAEVADTYGLKLRHLNIETIGRDDQYQCVDTADPHDLPRHPGGVDPQFNPEQYARVLSETKAYVH